MRPSRRELAASVFLPQVAVLVVYIWYFTAGLWVRLPDANSTILYDQLSAAFLEGKPYLLNQPSPELVALPNPYVVGQRRDVPYIGDASLYAGRDYLYWGPVPAALLAAFKAGAHTGPINDAFLAGLFTVGIFVLLSSLTALVWNQHFNDLPRASLAASIVLVGLLPPLTWMMNSPLVYEAALASASFFFLGGVFAAYRVVSMGADAVPGLALAGLCWALALGCQFTQIMPITVALALTTFCFGRPPPGATTAARAKVPLIAMWCLPAVMIVGLGWYNYARFGSVLEFGYRYQLALIDLHRNYDRIFRPVFILPNVFNYLVNPFIVRPEFPFVLPKHGSALEGLPFRLLRIYRTEAITGILLSAPVLLYGVLPVVREIAALRAGGWRRWLNELTEAPIRWLHWIASGTILANAPVLLLFFYSAPRYLVAVLPMVSLLTVLGLWQVIRRRSESALKWRVNIFVAVILAVWSITVTSLIAISSSQDRFAQGNPELIQSINRLLSGD